MCKTMYVCLEIPKNLEGNTKLTTDFSLGRRLGWEAKELCLFV